MWHASGSASDDVDAWRRRQRPDNELPVSVPFDVLLGRTDDIAVAITGVRAFTTGVDFTVAIRTRSARRGDLIHRLGGHQLLLGFEYADGRTATNVGSWPPEPGAADAPLLTSGGGGGGLHAADHEFFLTPLPQPGDLAVVCAWPAFDLPETRTILDASPVVDAARRAIVLWPEPADELPPIEAEPPQVPAGGWFARVVGRDTETP